MAKKKYPEYCFVRMYVLYQHLKYLNTFNYTVYSLTELTSTMNDTLQYLHEEVRNRTELISLQNLSAVKDASSQMQRRFTDSGVFSWSWTTVTVTINVYKLKCFFYWALSPELGQASPYLPTLNNRFSYPFLSSSVTTLWHLGTSDLLSFRSEDFCVFHSADKVQIMLLNRRLQFSVVCNAA